MAQAPTKNAASLFALITGTPPFQPYFHDPAKRPVRDARLPRPGKSQQSASRALDSTGQPWVYTGGYTYDTQSDTSTDLQGVVTVYDNNLNPTGTYHYTGDRWTVLSRGSMAADAAGHVFFVNSNNTISEFGSSGAAISPSGWLEHWGRYDVYGVWYRKPGM